MYKKILLIFVFIFSLGFTSAISYIIDDFEDGEFAVNNLGGGWYEFADPSTSSVSRTVITGDVPSGGGVYAARISGDVIGAIDSWASIGAGTNLNPVATPENLNLTTGIRLYMKGNYGTGTNVAFRIQIVSTNITDYSFWNFSWTPQSNWTYVTIPWTSFNPPGWGQGNGMNLTQVLSQVQAIQFAIVDTTGGAVNNTGNNWYIDNIEIYGVMTPTFTFTTTPYAGTPTNTPTITPTTAKCKRFLAYYPYWVSTYRADKIPYNRLTHICHAFVQPQANGSLSIPSGYLEPALITNAHAAGVKVLVSIGGANEVARQNFVTIAASASLRTAFANAVEAFCRTYGYDGADIDWEFPQNATERTNQNLLIQALRDKFNSSPVPAPNWEITMAVSPGNWYGQWNDYAYLNNIVDFYNLMTYDYHGEWSSHSGHNSPLYRGTDPIDGENIDWSNNYMTITRGVPASKMNLGIPFYGYRFPNSETLYDSFVSGAVQNNYNLITPLIGSGWTYHWDSGSYVPYLTYDSGTGLICYDNPSSVSEKVNYALNSKGYGGIFMWEITADYSAGNQPLLDAMWNSYSSFCGLTTPTFTRTVTSSQVATNSFTATKTVTQSFTQTATNIEQPSISVTYTSTLSIQTPTPTWTTGDCIHFYIDRTNVPPMVFMKKITLKINVGNCSSCIVYADGIPIPSVYDSIGKTCRFTTDGTVIQILRYGYTGGATNAVTKATLCDDKKWAYSFTFDDARPSVHDIGLPMLEALGFRAGVALNTQQMQETYDTYVMSWQKVSNLRAHNWSLFDHNYSHQVVTCDNIATETIPVKNAIETRFSGYLCTHFVYPYCNISNWTCIRDSGLFLSAENYTGNNYVDVIPSNPFVLNRNPFTGTGLASFNAAADNAANDTRPRWLIYFTHNIEPGSTIPGTYDTNQATLSSHLNYVYNTYGEGGLNNMWFAPSDEVMQYLLVRQYATVTYMGEYACSTGVPTPSHTRTATPTATSTPTPTSTPISNQQLAIGNLVIYPNPYNPLKQDLRIKFDMEGTCKLIKVKIYTVGFRMIKEFIFEGNYMVGENTINIERKHLYKLANGIYYILINAEQTDGISVKSCPDELVILK
ncbi:MAG: glycosyl hydrolase family 18 protein [Candidatus Goldbacteria bacterium]|nr:glycosyl hydrolase family 18 protein [Candidatus Goldiibacteriota bacterium]